MIRWSTGALAIALAGWLGHAPQTPPADHARNLASGATIRRDTYGIPHILANNEEAAAFAFGFAQAEDHAVEIARRYVRARGDEALYFGSQGVENDFAMRRFDNLETSARGLDAVSPQFARFLKAYAAGINRYVELNRKQLPSWIPVFDAADVLANIRARGVEAAASARLVRQLQEKYEAKRSGTPPERAEREEAPGSNAFALAGSRTTTGHPILLANPHLSWASRYWEAHLTVPGVINFFGNTLAGYPVLWAGFNEHLGWANTVNAVDLEDIYALPLTAGRTNEYTFNGEPRRLTTREIVVQVRAADGTTSEERRTYEYSHLGPILYRTGTHAFAIRSVRLESHLQFEGFYRLSKTRTLEEFQATLRTATVFSTNFVYADRDGNILYLWNAQIPKRPDDGTDYSLDVPGDTDKYVWKERHAIDDLPRLLNPPAGYIQSANNPPWYTSDKDPIDPARFPSYFDRGPLGLRPQLAIDLLNGRQKFSLEDVKALKYSTRMLLAERVKGDLVRALRQQPTLSADAQAGLRTLEGWDGRVAATSRGAVLFQRFWDTYSAATKDPFARAWSRADPFRTPTGLGNEGAAVRHLEDAVKWTRAEYGDEAAEWGQVHRFRAPGLDLPADGASGDYGTFRVMRFQPASNGPRIAGYNGPGVQPAGFGDGWILLVHFSKPVTAWSVLAYGQTLDESSAHSRDQLEVFAKHELRPVYFTEAEIQAHKERVYHPGW